MVDSQSSKNTKFLAFGFKAFISVSLLWFLFSNQGVSISDIAKTIYAGHWGYFTLGVLLIPALIFFKAYRWSLLLECDHIRYPLSRTLLASWAGYTLGDLTPGRLGEFARVGYLKRDIQVPFIEGLTISIIDRIYDLFFLIAFGILSGFHLLYPHSVFYIPVEFVLISLLGYLSIFVLSCISQKIPLEMHRFKVVEEMIRKLSDHIRNRKATLLCLLITIISYCIYFTICFFLIKTLSITTISITTAAFIMSLTSLIMLIPITVAGFGTREMSVVYLMGLYHVSESMALSFSLVFFTTFLMFGGFIGGVSIILLRKPLSSV